MKASVTTSPQTSVEVPQEGVPGAYRLDQTYPNPFNPTTVIRYAIPDGAHVTLVVYDLLGRDVARLVDGIKPAGTYAVTFDGSLVASGVYYYVLRSGGYNIARAMVVMK